MRTLAAALTTAQRASNRRSYLQAVISDRFANIRRLEPDTWYAGSEDDGPHAAACAGDNSITRLRVNAAQDLFRARVTTPDAADAWSTWGATVRAATSTCAIAFNGANGIVLAVDNVNRALVYESTSSDNGATWSAFALAVTHSTVVNHIACAMKSDGTVLAVVNNGANLSAYKKSAGVWGAANTSATADLTSNAIAVHYSGDWNILTTGTPTAGGSRLASRIFGDGFSQAANTWSVSRTIIESAPGSNVTYDAPSLALPNVYRLTVREAFSGTGAFDRTMHSLSPATADFASNLWADPRPLDFHDAGGLALSSNSTHLFLTNARKVVASVLAVDTLDVTADVVGAELIDDPLSSRLGHLDLVNPTGVYNAEDLVEHGNQVAISPGYYDADGTARTSTGPIYWIVDIEYDSEANPPVCRLWLGSAFAWLNGAGLSRSLQHVAGAKTLFAILQDLAARVGPFELTTSGASAALSALTPAVLIPPGRTPAAAFRELLARVPDALTARGEVIIANNPVAADSADATYRYPHAPATAHPVTSARLRSGRLDHNHIRVLGGATGSVVGEAIDYTDIAAFYAAPLIVADRELTTATLASDRAAALARREAIAARTDQLVAPVHCGLEVNDVIDVEDTRTHVAPTKMRVRSLRLVYAKGPKRNARYDHVLILGAA